MPLDDLWRNLEVLWVLGVHGNAVHQLVFIGKLLVVELLLQVVQEIHARMIFDGVGIPSLSSV